MARKKERVESVLDILCPTCQGKGHWFEKLRIGKRVTVLCKACAGTGLDRIAQSEYSIVEPEDQAKSRKGVLKHDLSDR
jgi:DnaJ-class molecular chaperone